MNTVPTGALKNFETVDVPSSGVRDPTVPIGPLDIVSTYAASNETHVQSQPAQSYVGFMPPAPSASLAKRLAVLGTVGAATLALIYLSYRALDFYKACWEIHPALATTYLVALGTMVVALGFFVARSLWRYSRLRQVDQFQRLAEQVKLGRAGDKQGAALWRMIDRFLMDHERNGCDEVRENIGRLRIQLRTHRDPARALEELEQYVLAKLDTQADEIAVMHGAQVAIGTALAFATLDFVIVAWQAMAVIDETSRLYAGRPGLLGTLRLLRHALAMAAVAEIAEQATELLAEAVASKTVARLGRRAAQGLGNGLLMLRLANAVKRQCRPISIPRGRMPIIKMLAKIKAMLTGNLSTPS